MTLLTMVMRIRPSKLGLEYIGSFSENGNRGEELKVTADGLHVRLFRVTAGDDKFIESTQFVGFVGFVDDWRHATGGGNFPRAG